MNTADLWPALQKVALLGTERAGDRLLLPPDAPQPLHDCFEGDREGVLLSLLAASSLQRRAGAVAQAPQVLGPASGAATGTCEPESQRMAPPLACARLRELLRLQEAPLLREWLEEARARRMLAPPDALPSLLRLGARSKAMRLHLMPVLGRRGQWLAVQNSAWKWARGDSASEQADSQDAERLFETGGEGARTAAFALLRSQDAPRALQVLQEQWSRESAGHRERWVEMLSENLSAHDEEFLESALDDRSAAVRKMAAQVLVGLPDSAFARRAHARACKYLSAHRGADKALRIEVDLPPLWDDDWARDGIERGGLRGAANAQATGQRTWWLVQMIALVPPELWAHPKATPREVIQSIARDEKALIEGFALAALRARDAGWIKALLQSYAASEAGSVPIGSLLDALSLPERQRMLAEMVREAQSSMEVTGDNTLPALLLVDAEPWSRELSGAVLDWMRALAWRAAEEKRPSNLAQWQFRGGPFVARASQFAGLMHIDALREAEDGWPQSPPDIFSSARDALSHASEIRRVLRREFDL